MPDDTQFLFANSLVEANRALIALGTIDKREWYTSAPATVRDCRFAYANLLAFKNIVGLTPTQSAQLETVLDRLKAHLRFFGEDV
jgi:hypothetical protein